MTNHPNRNKHDIAISDGGLASPRNPVVMYLSPRAFGNEYVAITLRSADDAAVLVQMLTDEGFDDRPGTRGWIGKYRGPVYSIELRDYLASCYGPRELWPVYAQSVR